MTVYDIVAGGPSEVRARVEQMLEDHSMWTVLPELLALWPKPGTKGHKDNFWHTVQVIGQTHDLGGSEDLKVVALMHDLGKGPTARYDEKRGWTFHMHEEVGARIVDEVFRRQGLPEEKSNYVKAVMLFAGRAKAVTEDTVTDSAVRRFARELFESTSDIPAGFPAVLSDVILFAKADITTKYEDKKYRFRKEMDDLHARICTVLRADEEAKWRMSIDAHDIMNATGLKPGRKLGEIKSTLEKMVKSGEIPDEPTILLERARHMA